MTGLGSMAASVRVAAPWETERARELDAMTLQDRKRANITDETGKQILDASTRAVWAAGPSALSLRYVLCDIAAASNEHVRSLAIPAVPVHE